MVACDNILSRGVRRYIFADSIRLATIFLCILTVLSGCISANYATVDADAVAKEYVPDPKNAVVYFVRESAFVAGGIKLPVTVDTQNIGSIKQGTFYRLLLSPGEHDVRFLHPVHNRSKLLSLDVNAGEVYFVTIRMKLGGDSSPILALVSEEEVAKMIDDCSLVLPDNMGAVRTLYVNEYNDYSKIKNTNSVEKLEEFLAAWPNSKRKEVVNERISKIELAREENDYRNAKEENSRSAYKGYLSRYPDGLYSKEANERLDSIMNDPGRSEYISSPLVLPDGTIAFEGEGTVIRSLDGKYYKYHVGTLSRFDGDTVVVNYLDNEKAFRVNRETLFCASRIELKQAIGSRVTVQALLDDDISLEVHMGSLRTIMMAGSSEPIWPACPGK